MNTLDDKIIERLYIRGDFCLTAPLMMGSGENLKTDMDVLTDGSGEVFIPGTALAGVLRNYLAEGCLEKDEQALLSTLLGSREKKSTQSLMYLSDATLIKASCVRPRDGVAIDVATKTAQAAAKYNYEVIEPGATFALRFEVVFRERHRMHIKQLKHVVWLMLEALEAGQIHLGAKTRRGFGRGKLKNIQILKLDLSATENAAALAAWLNFDWETLTPNLTLAEFAAEAEPAWQRSRPATQIEVQFSLPYSLLIRDYLTDPNDPDTVQLYSNGVPVIPGTSWAGAIKHQMHHLCEELGMTPLRRNNKPTFAMLDNLFGFVELQANNPAQQAKASRIVFEESPLEKTLPLEYTRNKIDRFTGGTITGALFTERPEYRGTEEAITCLQLTIKPEQKQTQEAHDAEIGLLLLAIQDLWHGIQPVGGETSVGRGILQGRSLTVNGHALDLNNPQNDHYQQYMRALYQEIAKTSTARKEDKP